VLVFAVLIVEQKVVFKIREWTIPDCSPNYTQILTKVFELNISLITSPNCKTFLNQIPLSNEGFRKEGG